MAKKRANGEGNIRKRKDGRWEGRYTVGYDEKTENGSPKASLERRRQRSKKSWRRRSRKRKLSMCVGQMSTPSAHGCKQGTNYMQSRICDFRPPNITGAE